MAVVITVLISGCSPDAEVPRIIGKAGYIALQPAGVFVPELKAEPGRSVNAGRSAPLSWYPPRRVEKRWKAIIVHHSLTDTGNVEAFDNFHRKVRKWKGIGYDFVIGNGKGSHDGSVEETFRWRKQIAGAHCGGTPRNWANVDGIGICLVGDFRKTRPTAAQMRSLIKLIRFLQDRYNIPTRLIYGHDSTPGFNGVKECPGRKFSIPGLREML